MEETSSQQGSLLDSPERTYTYAAFLFFVLSLACGLFPFANSRTFGNVEYFWISSSLWVLFGLVALYCLYQAFFDMWLHGLRLIGIYGVSGIGVMFGFLTYGNAIYTAISVGFVVFGLWQAWELVKIIWRVRVEKIIAMGPDKEEEALQRYDLDYWPVLPFFFFVTSVVSFICYAYWYIDEPFWNDDNMTLGIYAMAELFMIMSIIHILKMPQEILFDEERVEYRAAMLKKEERGSRFSIDREEQYDDEHESKLPFQLKTPTLLKSKVLKNPVTLLSKTPHECPICKNKPVTETRICPSCDEKEEFAFCKFCESYLRYCDDCGQSTFSVGSCMNCGHSMKRTVDCAKCGSSNVISRMRRA